ncbi:hypothetical protein VTL71DRAFT_8858 [Oculimacula yallundae]|uniref:Uncharacterized protein n=1 Tax=Oculimacula yallundae TaxID=86028 RepID=A0ABR4BT36_9HELO
MYKKLIVHEIGNLASLEIGLEHLNLHCATRDNFPVIHWTPIRSTHFLNIQTNEILPISCNHFIISFHFLHAQIPQ